jgi:hypothetical protein
MYIFFFIRYFLLKSFKAIPADQHKRAVCCAAILLIKINQCKNQANACIKFRLYTHKILLRMYKIPLRMHKIPLRMHKINDARLVLWLESKFVHTVENCCTAQKWRTIDRLTLIQD